MVSGRSVFNASEKIQGEVTQVMDAGLVVKTDTGEERVIHEGSAKHVGDSGLEASAGTIPSVSLTAAQFTSRERDRLAKSGAAMSDGSFPIRNRSDLRNAIRALGRAKDRAAAKRHIIARARKLGATDSLPDGWAVTASADPGKREALVGTARQAKIEKVMSEFKAGRLKSSSGEVVTDRKQALAIAMSMAKSLTAASRRFEEGKHRRKAKGQKGGGQFTFSGNTVLHNGETVGKIVPTDNGFEVKSDNVVLDGIDAPSVKGVQREIQQIGHPTKIDRGDAVAVTHSFHPDLARFAGRKAVAAAGFDESKHPRDPGGEGGGRWVPKGTTDASSYLGPRNPDPAQEGMSDGIHQVGDRHHVYENGKLVYDAANAHDAKAFADNRRYNQNPDQADFDLIEQHAQEWLDQGYEPSDAEPGEWLQLTNPDTGHVVTIGPDGPEDDGGDFYGDSVDSAADDLISNLEGAEPTEVDFEDHAREYMDDLAQDDPEFDPQSFIQAVATRYFEKKKGETASALTAAAAGLAPVKPPKSWFDKPNLQGPTALTVTADGQIYGHAALWGTCHTGISGQCRQPPRSQSSYQYFHLGELETAEGDLVHVGRVTMNTGHAPLTASRDQTVRHYDDTGTGAAHVRAYEDDHGIVLAGAVQPDLSEKNARTLRAAPVSGDWRSIGGKLELVGMLAVNVPGFPVPRAMAASLIVEDEPHTMAMVAAGMYCDPKDEERKLKALVARAKGVDGLYAAAMGGSDSERRMRGVVAASPFDPSKHPHEPAGSSSGGRWARVTRVDTGETTYREGLASKVVSELRAEGEVVNGGPDDTVKVAPMLPGQTPTEDARVRSGESGFVQDTVQISRHGKTYNGTIEKVTPGAAMVTYTTDNGKTKTIRVPHNEYKVVEGAESKRFVPKPGVVDPKLDRLKARSLKPFTPEQVSKITIHNDEMENKLKRRSLAEAVANDDAPDYLNQQTPESRKFAEGLLPKPVRAPLPTERLDRIAAQVKPGLSAVTIHQKFNIPVSEANDVWARARKRHLAEGTVKDETKTYHV